MQLGLIGLGKMGNNMRERLRRAGIEVVGYDRNPEVSDVASVDEMIQRLQSPRSVWVMVPAGPVTDSVITELGEKLESGDIVVDGGNSRFSDDQKHAGHLGKKGIAFVDCGVSGGVWGLENGYGLMAGGRDEDIERLMPVFDALRPEGERSDSFVHVGEVGAGHYAKMVHNGIEYGMMQSLAEGYELLESKDIIKDVTGTFKAWQQGTVVRSWLLDLLVRALEEDPHLDAIKGYVEDSGEGRWTVEEALAQAVPLPAITASIFARFESRQEDSQAMKAVAALRNQFGGHAVKKA
ncbi:phosphogluconate dehydrogenase (NAD(+)-dependent, decarboxylating) [Arthrobacter sp. UM1]|uniref:phosphogluconate dehydrogenase (NAD(+)-dependent, decarboxylating) n=1 Tax=Arthrobacter sp. UM1 TaxID=2766776 RepID=UPI001CF6956B|nr:decarboxylating 6-phosphogluconate dehydrogenase [Arthrobacter sp. UM1]MCB4208635.1 decarboxylating 6-phosphogluconate dehydrogenase [Arthrobacter sp. UM1]